MITSPLRLRFTALAIGLTLSLSSLASHPVVALSPATGDPAAALYQSTKVVRIDLSTSSPLTEIGADTYVDATFKLTSGTTVYGETSGIGAWDIKLRLKGKRSLRTFPAKGALRLEFPDTEHRVFGIKRMTLNNMVQDASKINEAIGYELFRAMGIAAPRTGYAQVWVNGTAYGLYLNVEAIDGTALKARNTVGGTKHLYEGSLGSQTNPLDPFNAHYQVDVGSSKHREDLTALLNAAQEPAATWYDSVAALADLSEMTRFWAVERYIGNWDGYSTSAISNYYLHSDTSGRFQLLPWGIDQIFGGGVDKKTPYGFGATEGGSLFKGCLVDTTCRTAYVQALRDVRDKATKMGLANTAASLHATLASKIATDTKDETSPTASKAAQVAASSFISTRSTALNTWLARLVRVTAPSVTGVAQIGLPLSATSGAWSYGPSPRYTFQWYRCTSAKGATPKKTPVGCKAIAAATSSTYTPSAADRTRFLRVRVKAMIPTVSAAWFSKATLRVP